MALSYKELRDKLKNGTRKGNWKKLNQREKALYRAAMAYTKTKRWGEMARDIVNRMVVEKLLALIEKLMETQGMRIFDRGQKKADELLQKGEENRLFAWAPRLRYWLKDPDYIFWLGMV